VEALVRRGGPALWAAIAVAALWSVSPAAWQVLTALKPDAQITRVPTVYLPRPPTGKHFAALFERKPFATYLANSAFVSGAATLLSVSLAALVARALARRPDRQRERGLAALLVIAVFPPILLLLPLYEAVRALGILNNPLALILPYAALNLPLAAWILDAGFRAVPRAIDEAAELDGLRPLRRLVRIQLPLVAPSLVTAALLVFIFSWNEFMLALTFMTRDGSKTVTAGIASVTGSSMFDVPWGQLAAGVVVATAPLVLLVLLFERRIASGLTRGAVKG
jgi:multiple sugar transport system permease protein